MTIDPSPGAAAVAAESEREEAPEVSRPERDEARRSAPDPVGREGREREARSHVDWKRTALILLGVALFAVVYFAPLPGPAIDPQGKAFALTREGKAALALFFLAATWWVTEVIPIGVTAIAIGVIQALFLIRPAREAFTDFMDPSVWFIFGSLMIGMVFTKTGLTRRLAYKMLSVVGERTSMIYLGCFVMTAGPDADHGPHRRGGHGLPALPGHLRPLHGGIHARRASARASSWAWPSWRAPAASSRCWARPGAPWPSASSTTSPAARSTSSTLTYYMLPVGVVMVVLLWVFFMLWYPPEKKTIPGLRDRVNRLYATLGPVSRDEIVALVLVLATIAVLSLRSFVPALEPLDKSAIILVPIVLLFLLKILSLEDLESASWNIVFLFGGAMSIGLCLWRTGAAEWLAVKWLGLFTEAHWLVFVLGMAAFVLVMTNFIMNVAAIAITHAGGAGHRAVPGRGARTWCCSRRW